MEPPNPDTHRVATPAQRSPGPPTATVPSTGQPAPPKTHRGLSRRAFLGIAGGAGAACALGAALGPSAWDTLFGGKSDPRGRLTSDIGGRLVLVTLYGGNDGLNTVIPIGNPQYEAGRGGLALPADTVLPLQDGFGLHPALTGFRSLFQRGQLAIVHGVGFANPNYSHFESMDIWQTALPADPDSTGWLGRWLDATRASPLQAVSIGPTTPTLLVGDRVQGAALPLGPLQLPGGPAERALYADVAEADVSEPGMLPVAGQANAALLTVDSRVGPIINRTLNSHPLGSSGSSDDTATTEGELAAANGGGGRAGAGVLTAQLSAVANLIIGGSPSAVYSVELGGFDTHADQAPTQKTLLAELDTGVTAFVEALEHHPGPPTVVVVYTEFGRRVTGNASGGSDHGWANVVFVAGPSVHGGFYGEPPSLSKLSDGNLVYTTDFRRVYATVFDSLLGEPPSRILGSSFQPIAFV
jgi:uncharacterized protein (DUF1501 family)